MNILMLTNTYRPFVGGVERSVETFSSEYRLRGHQTFVITPEYENMPENEIDVLRVPALQNFNGSDFSVKLPAPPNLAPFLEKFRPDLIHSHHPFLIGDTALRIASSHRIPLVYTFHTLYEQYTHYVPGDSPPLKRFVSALTTGYANLCDHVFAPSESAAELLRSRGVTTPVTIIPTGIYPERYMAKRVINLRKRLGLPSKAFVVGLVSRIAPEKNIDFLCTTVARFVSRGNNRYFLVAGQGPALDRVKEIFAAHNQQNRLLCLGTLHGDDLVAAYRAMNVFAFASHSETQGIVLAEAMASGIPVVAIDAPGVREIVIDRCNGRLLSHDDEQEYLAALDWIASLPLAERWSIARAARKTAQNFSIHDSVSRALLIYQDLVASKKRITARDSSMWEDAVQRIKTEWELVVNMTRATGAALRGQDPVITDQLP